MEPTTKLTLEQFSEVVRTINLRCVTNENWGIAQYDTTFDPSIEFDTDYSEVFPPGGYLYAYLTIMDYRMFKQVRQYACYDVPIDDRTYNSVVIWRIG